MNENNSTEFNELIKTQETFLNWIPKDYVKRYSSEFIINAMDKASEQLIIRKVSRVPLWEINDHRVFKSIYDAAKENKLFRIFDKKTYSSFIQIGPIYLKYLKTKSSISGTTFSTSDRIECYGSKKTIKQAIVQVMKNEQTGMNVEQIYNKIIEANLYSFGAQSPCNVIRVEIDRACEGSNYTIRSARNDFRFERNQRGEKVYFLLEDFREVETSITRYTRQVEFESSKVTDNERFKHEILNESIEERFRLWMNSKYSQTTIRIYCRAIYRVIDEFNDLLKNNSIESSDLSETVHQFVSQLNQSRRFSEFNSAVHNQFSAALGAYIRFIDEIDSETYSTCGGVALCPSLEEVVDLEDGMRGIREILNAHFLSLCGYSNIGILWDAVQNSLSMFLNDNAINTIDEFTNFFVSAFNSEVTVTMPHIWESAPDYPRNSRGLAINIARHNGGILTREQLDDFFSRVKLTVPINSSLIEKEQLLFYGKATFIVSEIVDLSEERCAKLSKALDTLFINEDLQYIVLRDISSAWFSNLPELPNGLTWTPHLLQEALRVCPTVEYHVILPELKGQALDTLGAAIVPTRSAVRTFADIVHRYLHNKYTLPLSISAENLRIELRSTGMLEGNELISNMHKALKDYRFAFLDNNQMVSVLER